MAEKRKSIGSRKKRNDDRTTLYAVLILGIVAFVLILIALSSVISKNLGKKETDGSGSQSSGGAALYESTAAPKDSTSPGTGEPETTLSPSTSDTVTDAPDTGSDETSRDSETTDEESSAASTDTGDTPPASDMIEIELKEEKSEDDGSQITMIYPTVTSAGRTEHTADEINAAIREYMDEKRRIMCIDSGGDEYRYIIEKTDVKYTGKSFFSAVVRGYIYSSDAPHPTVFVYAVNCDTSSCEILEGEKLIKNYSRVKDLFLSGKFTETEGEDDLLDNTSYEDLIIEYRPEYGIYPSVYYTGTSFGLALETVYSLGGYALFEIPTGQLGGDIFTPAD